MRTREFTPTLASVEDATAFVEETLQAEGCPGAVVMKLCIVVDELFSNIARYSGAAAAKVTCGVAEGAAVLVFCDNGAPYDPTKTEEPDTTLAAEEREMGGLGILMVRRLVTQLRYARVDGWNELTVRRVIEGA